MGRQRDRTERLLVAEETELWLLSLGLKQDYSEGEEEAKFLNNKTFKQYM